MTPKQVALKILGNPHLNTVVIGDGDDLMREQAIHQLLLMDDDTSLRINNSLEKNTLLIYFP